MENNDCFSKMMAASKQAAKKVAKEKATKVSCPNCDSTFPNKGALVQHCKYKHRAKSDVKKINQKSTSAPSRHRAQVQVPAPNGKNQLHPGHRSVLFNRLEQVPRKRSRHENLKRRAQGKHAHVFVSQMPRSTLSFSHMRISKKETLSTTTCSLRCSSHPAVSIQCESGAHPSNVQKSNRML